MREAWLIRQNESNAAMPWRSRFRRAGTYAGILWVVAIVGVLLAKYAFDLIDRPILTVLVQITVLPILLLGCLIFGYLRVDLVKKSYERKDKKHEEA